MNDQNVVAKACPYVDPLWSWQLRHYCCWFIIVVLYRHLGRENTRYFTSTSLDCQWVICTFLKV